VYFLKLGGYALFVGKIKKAGMLNTSESLSISELSSFPLCAYKRKKRSLPTQTGITMPLTFDRAYRHGSAS
jgi:hypothetical protein